MTSGESTLIFLHIPKTAGKTLESILDRQYQPSQVYNIYGVRGSIPRAVERLKKLSEPSKKRLRLIKGHYEYGLHQYLPQRCHYFTLLRHPVDRVLSQYFFVKRRADHPLHSEAGELSLEEYVRSGISVEVDNHQTWLIAGRDHDHEFGKTPRSLLKLARDNARKDFALVGLVERFDETLALLSLQFGWRKPYYRRRNVTRRRPTRDSLPSQTVEMIEHYNRLDLELYEWAQREFQQKVAARSLAVSRKVYQIRVTNKAYRTYKKTVKRASALLSGNR